MDRLAAFARAQGLEKLGLEGLQKARVIFKTIRGKDGLTNMRDSTWEQVRGVEGNSR